MPAGEPNGAGLHAGGADVPGYVPDQVRAVKGEVMHRLSRIGRARARRRADVRVGALRSVYSLYDKPPSQQAIQFLIKKPIMKIPVQPAKPVTPVAHGWMLQREQTRAVTPRLLVESFRMSPMGVPAATFEELAPSQTYVPSNLRSRLSHHPNSGLQGGVDREGSPGGP